MRDERRRALRALLLRPLMTAESGGAGPLHLVRRHAPYLREWLNRNVDWTLTVEPEVARLRKVPSDLSDRTRPALDETTSQPFTRRRDVLFCLALAALERSERQTALGRLADEVGKLHRADPTFEAQGLPFDLKTQDGRRDLVHAVRLLLSLGVLARVHGDEQQFLHDQGDVLYNVNRPALSLVLAGRRPPSMVIGASLDERLKGLVEEPAPDSEDARNRRLRVSLTRRLLDDPVLYYEDLSAEELAYLTSQRAHLARQIEEATGLVAEVRQEGIALVDEGGHLTDFGLPEEGTEGHLTLLVAELLSGHARARPGAVVPRAEVVAHVAALIEEHGSHWRRDAREPGAEEPLTDDTLARLAALGLVRLTPEGVLPRPAIGRFALAPPQGTSSLFPELDRAPAPRGRPRSRP
ncbi:MAG: TIGR02678 family protein [Myxococcaceae bacterium]